MSISNFVPDLYFCKSESSVLIQALSQETDIFNDIQLATYEFLFTPLTNENYQKWVNLWREAFNYIGNIIKTLKKFRKFNNISMLTLTGNEQFNCYGIMGSDGIESFINKESFAYLQTIDGDYFRSRIQIHIEKYRKISIAMSRMRSANKIYYFTHLDIV